MNYYVSTRLVCSPISFLPPVHMPVLYFARGGAVCSREDRTMAVQEFNHISEPDRLPKAERPESQAFTDRPELNLRGEVYHLLTDSKGIGDQETRDEGPAGHSRTIASETHVTDLSLNKSPHPPSPTRGKKS